MKLGTITSNAVTAIMKTTKSAAVSTFSWTTNKSQAASQNSDAGDEPESGLKRLIRARAQGA